MRKRASELLWKHAWHKRVGSKVHGRVESVVASIGIFVWIDGGPTGLVPNASLAKIKFAATLQPGDRVTVEVQRVDQRKGTGRLLLLARVADQGSSSTSRDGSKL